MVHHSDEESPLLRNDQDRHEDGNREVITRDNLDKQTTDKS